MQTRVSLATGKRVTNEVNESCEAVVWIGVVFDHIEREVVGSAKGPHGDEMQRGSCPCRGLSDEQRRCDASEKEKQDSLRPKCAGRP